MEDSDIKKIIETTIDEQKKSKINKRWHDPVKAKDAFDSAVMWGFVAVVVAGGFGMIYGVTETNHNYSIIPEPILSALECEQLKEIFADKELSQKYREQIQQYALIKCL